MFVKGLNRIPWQIKLVILMLFMAILPSLLISYSITDIIRNELKFNINNQLIYSSKSIAVSIDSKLKKNLEILDFTKSVFENPNLDAQQKIAAVISSVEKINNIISMTLLVEDNGRLNEAISSKKDFILRNNQATPIPDELKTFSFNKASFNSSQTSFIERPFYNREMNSWIIHASAKVQTEKLPRAYLVATFDLSDISQEIENHLLNKMGTVFVTDSSDSEFLSSNLLTQFPEKITKEATSLLKSKNRITFVNNYSDDKAGNYVSCFSYTETVNWVVVVNIQEATAYAAVNKAFMFFVLFIGISIILSIITALLFSNHMSKPIINMANVSQKIAEGNFNVHIDYEAKDSIGLLSSSLGKMGSQLEKNFNEINEQKQQLKDYSKNLEIKVEQRTNELSESNKDLKKAYKKVLELNEEKNEFLGIAAHDLKNPLIAISSFADILKTDKDLPEKQQHDFLDEIMNASRHMFAIVKNLLDVNAIEQGNLNTKMESISLKLILREVVAQYKEAASRKNINIIEQHVTEKFNVNADYNLSLQIIQNILSNAIKFSPVNKNIFLTVRSPEDLTMIEVCIKDEGPGFTDADKKKMFQKFSRLSARPTGGEHSTGLGLSIVKKLVEMLGGAIRIESEAGKGAEFIIALPKAVDESLNHEKN